MLVWGSRCLQNRLQELIYSLYVLSPGCATHFVKLIKISGPYLVHHKGSHHGMGNDSQTAGAGLSTRHACQDFKGKTTGRLCKLLPAPALSGHSIYFSFIISSVTLIKLFLWLTAWRDQDIRGNTKGKTTLSRPLPCFSAVSQINVCNLWSFK